MITRSLSRLHEGAKRRSPGRGGRHKGVLPRSAGPGARVRHGGNKRRGNTAASNYWSSTSNANNPDNAWNVNFNNGNVNDNDKSNNNFVRAVRGGS